MERQRATSLPYMGLVDRRPVVCRNLAMGFWVPQLLEQLPSSHFSTAVYATTTVVVTVAAGTRCAWYGLTGPLDAEQSPPGPGT